MSKGDDFKQIRDAIMSAYYEQRYPGRDMVMEDVKKFYHSIGLKQVCLWCGDPLPAPHRSFCGKGTGCSDSFYLRYSWTFIREREVHGNICPDCGKSTVKDLHHIIPISLGGSFFKRDNLIALCNRCHVKRHNKSVRRKHLAAFQDFSKHQRALPGMEKPSLKKFTEMVL